MNEEKVDTMLRAAGFSESCQMDSSSRAALLALCHSLSSSSSTSRKSVDSTDAVNEVCDELELFIERSCESEYDTSCSPPVPHVPSLLGCSSKVLLERLVSDMTDGNPTTGSTNEEFSSKRQESSTCASVAGSSSRSSSSSSTEVTVMTGNNNSNNLASSTKAYRTERNDSTSDTSRKMPVLPVDDVAFTTSPTTTPSTGPSNAILSKEQLILDQMEQQTLMLIQLHQRMEQLARTVGRLANEATVSPDRRSSSHQHPSNQHPQLLQSVTPHHVLPQPPSTQAPRAQQPQNDLLNQQPQQPHHEMYLFAIINRLYNVFQDFPRTVEQSKLTKIIRLFVTLYRRNVRPFDVGLAVKIVFMVSLFISRIRRRRAVNSNHNNSDDSASSDNQTAYSMAKFVRNLFNVTNWSFTTTFTVTTICVVCGILLQNGYFTFVYNFFIKDNYVARIMQDDDDLEIERILAGERDAGDPHPQPPLPARQRGRNINNNGNAPEPQAAAVPAAAPAVPAAAPAVPAAALAVPAAAPDLAFNWRHTLLGGGIAPPVAPNDNNHDNNYDNIDPQQQIRRQPLPLTLLVGFQRFLHDVFIFFGSFFLSIFPMWHPTPIPVRVVQVEPAGPNLEQPAGQNNGGGNGGGGPDQIPQVRPPIDPAENDDTDD